MANKVQWDKIDYDAISVTAPKEVDLMGANGRSRGTWWYIGITYTYANGEEDKLRVEWPVMKTSGIKVSDFDGSDNEADDEEDKKKKKKTFDKKTFDKKAKSSKKSSKETKYQIGTIGFLEEKIVEVRDKIRHAICRQVAKHSDACEYLEDFQPDKKKGGVKRIYWISKKDPKKRRWYPKVDKKTGFFMPNPACVTDKKATKTLPLPFKDLLESENAGLEIEHRPIEEFGYFYAGATALSIISKLYQSLIFKLNVTGKTSAQEDEAENYAMENPDAMDAIMQNLKLAKISAKSIGSDDEEEDPSSEPSDEEEEEPKSKKGKATTPSSRVPKDLKALMNGSDDEEEEEPKPKKGKKVSDEEEEPKKGKGKSKKIEEIEEDEEPKPKKGKKASEEEEEPKTKKGKKKEEEEEVEEEEEPKPKKGKKKIVEEEPAEEDDE